MLSEIVKAKLISNLPLPFSQSLSLPLSVSLSLSPSPLLPYSLSLFVLSPSHLLLHSLFLFFLSPRPQPSSPSLLTESAKPLNPKHESDLRWRWRNHQIQAIEDPLISLGLGFIGMVVEMIYCDKLWFFFSFIFKSDLQWAMGVYGGWLWVFVVVGGGLWQFCGCLWWLLRWVCGGCWGEFVVVGVVLGFFFFFGSVRLWS